MAIRNRSEGFNQVEAGEGAGTVDVGQEGAGLSQEGLVGQGRDPAPPRGHQVGIRLPRTCLEVFKGRLKQIHMTTLNNKSEYKSDLARLGMGGSHPGQKGL